MFKNSFQKWKIVLKSLYKIPSFEDLMGNFHSWEILGRKSSFFFFTHIQVKIILQVQK